MQAGTIISNSYRKIKLDNSIKQNKLVKSTKHNRNSKKLDNYYLKEKQTLTSSQVLAYTKKYNLDNLSDSSSANSYLDAYILNDPNKTKRHEAQNYKAKAQKTNEYKEKVKLFEEAANIFSSLEYKNDDTQQKDVLLEAAKCYENAASFSSENNLTKEFSKLSPINTKTQNEYILNKKIANYYKNAGHCYQSAANHEENKETKISLLKSAINSYKNAVNHTDLCDNLDIMSNLNNAYAASIDAVNNIDDVQTKKMFLDNIIDAFNNIANTYQNNKKYSFYANNFTSKAKEIEKYKESKLKNYSQKDIKNTKEKTQENIKEEVYDKITIKNKKQSDISQQTLKPTKLEHQETHSIELNTQQNAITEQKATSNLKINNTKFSPLQDSVSDNLKQDNIKTSNAQIKIKQQYNDKIIEAESYLSKINHLQKRYKYYEKAGDAFFEAGEILTNIAQNTKEEEKQKEFYNKAAEIQQKGNECFINALNHKQHKTQKVELILKAANALQKANENFVKVFQYTTNPQKRTEFLNIIGNNYKNIGKILSKAIKHVNVDQKIKLIKQIGSSYQDCADAYIRSYNDLFQNSPQINEYISKTYFQAANTFRQCANLDKDNKSELLLLAASNYQQAAIITNDKNEGLNLYYTSIDCYNEICNNTNNLEEKVHYYNIISDVYFAINNTAFNIYNDPNISSDDKKIFAYETNEAANNMERYNKLSYNIYTQIASHYYAKSTKTDNIEEKRLFLNKSVQHFSQASDIIQNKELQKEAFLNAAAICKEYANSYNSNSVDDLENKATLLFKTSIFYLNSQQYENFSLNCISAAETYLKAANSEQRPEKKEFLFEKSAKLYVQYYNILNTINKEASKIALGNAINILKVAKELTSNKDEIKKIMYEHQIAKYETLLNQPQTQAQIDKLETNTEVEIISKKKNIFNKEVKLKLPDINNSKMKMLNTQNKFDMHNELKFQFKPLGVRSLFTAINKNQIDPYSLVCLNDSKENPTYGMELKNINLNIGDTCGQNSVFTMQKVFGQKRLIYSTKDNAGNIKHYIILDKDISNSYTKF